MKTSRKMFILLALSITFLTDVSWSQTEENQNKERILSSQSLQIVFINETALYYHINLSPKLDLKSGISATWSYDEKTDGEGYNQSQFSPSPLREQKMKRDLRINNYEIILSTQLMYSFNGYEYAKVYLGCGPALSYASSKYSTSSRNYTDTTFSNDSGESKSSVLGIGPSFSLLIKSRLYGSIYLTSEYNFTAYYTWNEESYSSQYSSKYSGESTASFSYIKDHTESTGWKMRFSNVRVGLLIVL